jgi:hypothetical protein
VDLPGVNLTKGFYIRRKTAADRENEIEFASRRSHMESQQAGTDTWSRQMAGGTLTFTTKALGNPVAGYVHEANFERGSSSYSMTRQSTEPLTHAEVEDRFADFISEIRHGQ